MKEPAAAVCRSLDFIRQQIRFKIHHVVETQPPAISCVAPTIFDSSSLKRLAANHGLKVKLLHYCLRNISKRLRAHTDCLFQAAVQGFAESRTNRELPLVATATVDAIIIEYCQSGKTDLGAGWILGVVRHHLRQIWMTTEPRVAHLVIHVDVTTERSHSHRLPNVTHGT